MTSLSRAALGALALVGALSSAAQAQQARAVLTCGAQSLRVGDATSLFVDATGVLCSTAGSGGGGGGATGSVTPAGTSGTSAQAIQGITGGVPVPVTGSFSSSPVTGTNEQDIAATRTLDATSTSSQQTYTLNGQSTLSFNFSGLAASGATVSFFQSNDWNGTTGTFTGISEVNTGTGVASLTRNTDGQSAIGIEGTKAIRVQVTTAGSGTITLATNISVRSRYQALRAPLPPGSNTIGSIGNTAFGISGTLPAFATTPTFNIGTTNGLALDATVIARLGTLGQKASAGSAPVVISSDQSAVPISAAALPLPAGAATAVKQPALGTAGTPSADVLSVQGVSGGTPQNVANAGTFAVQNTAATPAGNNITGRVGIDQTTPGTTNKVSIGTDGTVAATQSGTWSLSNITGTVSLPTGAATAVNQTSTQNNPGVSGAKADAVQGVTNGVPLPVNGSVWFLDAVTQTLAAGATFTGTSRTNVGNGAVSPYAYFQAQAFSTQAGTLSVNQGAFAQTIAVAANTPATLKVPALGSNFTVSFTNSGGASATYSVLSGYTLN